MIANLIFKMLVKLVVFKIYMLYLASGFGEAYLVSDEKLNGDKRTDLLD